MRCMTDLRSLPSVEHLLQAPEIKGWTGAFGRPLTVDAIRSVLDEVRAQYQAGSPLPDQANLIRRVGACLEDWTAPTLRPVINATGVILHTNLGRSPLSRDAARAVVETALGYSTLEYDLKKGKRGSRLVHAEALLCR